MRFTLTRLVLFVVAIACLASVALAWDKDDYEIFDLQAALEKAEGKGATFYSILNLTPKASANDIKKAYRKKSLELHPDKNPNVPNIAKRFERLGVINKILRDARRDRYDHFLSKGFPRWRGTGYYYARFRPGLLSVVAFLAMLSAGVQHLVRMLNWRRDAARLDRLRRSAQLVAWGPRFQSEPKDGSKRVRVPLSGFPGLPPAPRAGADGNVDWDAAEREVRQTMSSGGAQAGPGVRMVDALVTPEMVFVLDPATGEQLPLDESAAPRPTLMDTWPFRLAHSTLDRFRPSTATLADNEGDDEIEEEPEKSKSSDNGTPKSAVPANGAARKRKGGKRR